MTNLKILEQLLHGNHLNPEELVKAQHILNGLNLELINRKN